MAGAVQPALLLCLAGRRQEVGGGRRRQRCVGVNPCYGCASAMHWGGSRAESDCNTGLRVPMVPLRSPLIALESVVLVMPPRIAR